MFFSGPVFAFQCEKDNSLENSFRESRRTLMIYVTEVALDKKETQKMEREHPESAGYVKILKVKYDTIENFKGNEEYNPDLKDLLGIGTGYVGFTPGTYYFITLPEGEDNEPKSYRYVSFCDVHFHHYRNDIEEYKQIIDKAKKLKERENG